MCDHSRGFACPDVKQFTPRPFRRVRRSPGQAGNHRLLTCAVAELFITRGGPGRRGEPEAYPTPNGGTPTSPARSTFAPIRPNLAYDYTSSPPAGGDRG